jgi:hypothetical protein
VRVAAVIAAAFAAGMLGTAVATRPAAPPVASATPPAASVTPTPEPTDDPRVFQQPLVSGCGLETGEAYAVAHGGGIARFDGRHWSLIDDTLRDLRAVACARDVVVAVGHGGTLVRIDPAARTIRSDVVTDVDLYAVDALDASTIYAAGADEVIVRYAGGRWEHIARGEAGRAWHAVYALSATQVWFAGDRGALFLFDGTRYVDRSIREDVALTVLGKGGHFDQPRSGPEPVLAGAADGRLFQLSDASEATVVARYGGAVRSLYAPNANVAYVVADALLVIARASPSAPGTASAATLPLDCPATLVFGVSAVDVWAIGRRDRRTGLARYDGQRWSAVARC